MQTFEIECGFDNVENKQVEIKLDTAGGIKKIHAMIDFDKTLICGPDFGDMVLFLYRLGFGTNEIGNIIECFINKNIIKLLNDLVLEFGEKNVAVSIYTRKGALVHLIENLDSPNNLVISKGTLCSDFLTTRIRKHLMEETVSAKNITQKFEPIFAVRDKIKEMTGLESHIIVFNGIKKNVDYAAKLVKEDSEFSFLLDDDAVHSGEKVIITPVYEKFDLDTAKTLRERLCVLLPDLKIDNRLKKVGIDDKDGFLDYFVNNLPAETLSRWDEDNDCIAIHTAVDDQTWKDQTWKDINIMLEKYRAYRKLLSELPVAAPATTSAETPAKRSLEGGGEE